VILVSPFDSVTALAQRHYPFLPVSLLLRHRFDSLSLAGAIDAPMIAIVAERDSIIPPEHSQRLFDAWKGPKTWQLLAGADHNGFDAHPAYWRAIDDFLRSREAASASR
jgi:pimeloyl-ACP methyl ester carboxylesterase